MNTVAAESEESDVRSRMSYVLPTSALYLMTISYALNFLDRQIINIVAEPIKLEMGLTDRSLGLLTGLSFAFFYTTLGIPIARLAERWDRTWILSGSLFVWSGFTALCGAATSFATLFVARMGVGVGEAGCLPTSHSMIAQYVPRDRLARAMATFQSGSPLGQLIGLAFGGIIAGAYGWRVAFVLAGVPGLLLAAIVLKVLKDPLRAGGVRSDAERVPFPEVIADLRGKPSFWILTVGAALGSLVNYAQGAFIASFYLRVHGDALATWLPGVPAQAVVGVALGLVLGLGGMAGMMLGGYVADRGTGVSTLRRYMKIAAWFSLLNAPLFVGVVMADALWVSLLCYLPATIAIMASWAPVWASLSRLARDRTRATVVAISLMVITVVGLGFGPLMVGALSDGLATSLGSAEGLRWALVASTTASVMAALFYVVARRHIDRDAGELLS